MKIANLTNMLRVLLTLIISCILISCSSSGSDEWPKLEADRLWQKLEQEQSDTEILSDNSLNNNETILLPSATASPSISLSDIDLSLNEIENKLTLHEKNIQLAVDKFENANGEDKDLHWRGIEIQKSRLNSDLSVLRDIVFRLADKQEAVNERQRATMLLKRAEALMPDISYNANIE